MAVWGVLEVEELEELGVVLEGKLGKELGEDRRGSKRSSV